MTTGKVRYYLHNLDSLTLEIKQLIEDIEDYKKMEVETLLVQVLSDMPRGTSVTSQVEDKAIKRADYITALENKLHRKLKLRSAINKVVNNLTGPKKELIQLKYLDVTKHTYDVVAHKLHRDPTYIRGLEGKIINNIITEFYT